MFRIGGDEFAVILLNEDYYNREALLAEFESAQKDIAAAASNDWEQVSIAVGVAVYDPSHDQSISDTARRADKIMYENKRQHKKARKQQNAQQ